MALGVGIAAGGGGAYAVFASSNQAGTAILLVLSAVFLLIGIQGTSLIRFSTGSNTVELERRRRTVELAVKEIVREEPERAAGIIEGAGLALPALGSISSSAEFAVLAAQYDENLYRTIVAMGYFAAGSGSGGDADFIVRDQEGRTISIVVRYRRHAVFNHSWLERALRLYQSATPILLVTNVPVPTSAGALVAEMKRDAPVKLITWRDESDNQALQDSLAEFFGSLLPS